MTSILLIIVFVYGYAAIAFESKIGLNKAASAMITGVLCWTVYILNSTTPHLVNEDLIHHLGDIASILFFLLGAMTIVELIDRHNGFSIITNAIKTRSKLRLLWIISIITFFLSSILDNLTTAIVMTSLCSKILHDKYDRMWFAGMIIIAANAGGAWSPLGDVTTTMLWIGGQISAMGIIKMLFIPSLFVCLIPLLILGRKFKKQTFEFVEVKDETSQQSERNLIFYSGIAMLLFVPVFKTLTHLPPFMGMLLSLSAMWIIISIIRYKKPVEVKQLYSVSSALQRIDTPSILFFLGILLSISALQSFGLLKDLAVYFNNHLHNYYLTGITLGLTSAVVDNVPLVAATQAMYDLKQYPTDHNFWEFIALTTGTGGSILIIGSAAGVAVMGIENIEFIWYLKKIGWLALIGFTAGIGVFLLQTIL
ncbi:MAG: sodium:proton antiporter NhaD [Bacteroidetes bacterium]|nr:sodium:proton antiporter NhaD [Bacteroidota bacterium]